MNDVYRMISQFSISVFICKMQRSFAVCSTRALLIEIVYMDFPAKPHPSILLEINNNPKSLLLCEGVVFTLHLQLCRLYVSVWVQ